MNCRGACAHPVPAFIYTHHRQPRCFSTPFPSFPSTHISLHLKLQLYSPKMLFFPQLFFSLSSSSTSSSLSRLGVIFSILNRMRLCLYLLTNRLHLTPTQIRPGSHSFCLEQRASRAICINIALAFGHFHHVHEYKQKL